MVENRSAETLGDMIMRHVRGGSIIHTDMWRGYNLIDESEEYQHLTVNHTVTSLAPGDQMFG